MATDYEARLRLPINPSPMEQLRLITTQVGLPVAIRYQRIVLGGRGPYMEFARDDLYLENFIIPEDQLWRRFHPGCYYIEWRSIDVRHVKLYQQLKTVDYADYRPQYFYISPFDLYTDTIPIIQSLRRSDRPAPILPEG